MMAVVDDERQPHGVTLGRLDTAAGSLPEKTMRRQDLQFELTGGESGSGESIARYTVFLVTLTPTRFALCRGGRRAPPPPDLRASLGLFVFSRWAFTTPGPRQAATSPPHRVVDQWSTRLPLSGRRAFRPWPAPQSRPRPSAAAWAAARPP